MKKSNEINDATVATTKKTVTISYQKGKNSYDKGVQLENDFAKYMQDELGYDVVNTRKSVSGKENVKGVQADIIGVEYDERGERLRKAALITLGCCFSGSILGLAGLLPDSFQVLFGTLIFGSFLYVIIGRNMNNHYTWAECKNHKDKIDIKTVRDFYHEVKDHNLSKDKHFTVEKMMFVSSGGFIDNALEFAAHNGIRCYTIKDKKIVRVKIL